MRGGPAKGFLMNGNGNMPHKVMTVVLIPGERIGILKLFLWRNVDTAWHE
jgi:hypothetical protein